MVTFFCRFFLKVGSDTRKSDVVTREVGVERVIYIRHVVLNVDLFIDCGFTFWVEVNSCVGITDGRFVYYGKLTLYSVKRLEDDACELGGGGTGNGGRSRVATAVSEMR